MYLGEDVYKRQIYRVGLIKAAIHNPLENAHIIAEARPDEIAVIIKAEPVDVKAFRAVSYTHLDVYKRQ